MSAENPASRVCTECGKDSMELMTSSSGEKLCPECCGDQEGGKETVAIDQLDAGFLSQLCQDCFANTGDLLPTVEGRMLCPE